MLRRFLCNQSRPIVTVFDNVTLLKHDSEQLSISCISEMRIIDNDGNNCRESLVVLLSMITSPLKLTITCNRNLSTSEKQECDYYYHTQFRAAKRVVDHISQRETISGYNPLQFRNAFLHRPDAQELHIRDEYDAMWFRVVAIKGPQNSKSAQNTTKDLLPDLSGAFLEVANFPLINRKVNDLTCSGCVVSLKSLSLLLHKQTILSKLTLVNTLIAHDQGKLSLQSLRYRDKLLLSRSVRNINITSCSFNLQTFVLFLRLLPPFAQLKLTNASFCNIRRILNLEGSVNSIWVYCQTDLKEGKEYELHSVESLLFRLPNDLVIPHCYRSANSTSFYATGPH